MPNVLLKVMINEFDGLRCYFVLEKHHEEKTYKIIYHYFDNNIVSAESAYMDIGKELFLPELQETKTNPKYDNNAHVCLYFLVIASTLPQVLHLENLPLLFLEILRRSGHFRNY